MRMVSRVSEGAGLCRFVYKIVEIMVASSDSGGGRVLGLLCVEQHGESRNLAAHFYFIFPCQIFSKFWHFAFALDRICVVTSAHAPHFKGSM